MVADRSNHADCRANGWRGRAHSGLTILEFLACTIAVIGGAWLGAVLLGIDVRNLAYTALSESKLLDKVPADLRPANPNEKIMTREQLLTTLHEELGSLRNQIATLRTGAPTAGSPENAAKGEHPATLELPPTKEKTLAYWERLIVIASGERALQRDAEVAFNANNA